MEQSHLFLFEFHTKSKKTGASLVCGSLLLWFTLCLNTFSRKKKRETEKLFSIKSQLVDY